MTQWRSTLLRGSAPLAEAIRIIDASSKQICLVVDDAERLLGTITDGDVRRAILNSIPLDAPAERVMNRAPITLASEHDREQAMQLMRSRQIHQIPIVDAGRRVVGLVLIDDLMQAEQRADNWVVLMAGGLGSRLRPLTEATPKPMLKVGSKPLLEIILENLVRQEFRRFYVSVNYRAEVIKEYLGDGSRWGVEIRYVDENERLGTAGPLTLLPEAPTSPILVMNADLLTKVDLRRLLDYHREHNATATITVREYDFQVPYGVVTVEGNRVGAIDEKPVQRFFVNAGIYVIEPRVIGRIPKNKFVDMPDVFRDLVADGATTVAFPIREYWLDIGHMDDFQQANREYSREFPDE